MNDTGFNFDPNDKRIPIPGEVYRHNLFGDERRVTDVSESGEVSFKVDGVGKSVGWKAWLAWLANARLIRTVKRGSKDYDVHY